MEFSSCRKMKPTFRSANAEVSPPSPSLPALLPLLLVVPLLVVPLLVLPHATSAKTMARDSTSANNFFMSVSSLK